LLASYFEGYEDIRIAVAREKQLKGCRREKNLNLIHTIDPEFKTLHKPGDGR
jgi:putative endonuclease